MKPRAAYLLPLVLGGLVAGLLLLLLPQDWSAGWTLWQADRGATPPGEPPKPPQQAPPERKSGKTSEEDDLQRLRDEAAARILALLEGKLNVEGARDKEAVLGFKDEQAYRDFLARAKASGLKVMDQMDALRTVRVGYDDLKALQLDLLAHATGYGEVGANYIAYHPAAPDKEDRAVQQQVGFGDAMLGFLGITGDNSQWGQGVTIAVLDSGIAADPTFGTGRLRYLDIGEGLLGTSDADGHGTAVGDLAAGLNGVAPGADLLSLKVTGADGTSDLFTLARGILSAVDAGASILVISLGAYENSAVLSQAIDYAYARGSVIVAASGNDQASTMTWPAANPKVTSVGAVTASGEQALFSNSGATLKLTAPGYQLNAAWLNNTTVEFSGTSAAAPVVAGAAAALMSQNPGATAAQATAWLQQYASDAGAPGTDPAYGSGILNVGWAMNAGNPDYYDTAVSSHYYNNQTGNMEFVVQNRSSSAVSGLKLAVSSSGGQTSYALPVLAAGASTVVAVPVNAAELSQSANGLFYQSQLINPPGTKDAVLSNNGNASTISRK